MFTGLLDRVSPITLLGFKSEPACYEPTQVVYSVPVETTDN